MVGAVEIKLVRMLGGGAGLDNIYNKENVGSNHSLQEKKFKILENI